jgi:hypothetical protein
MPMSTEVRQQLLAATKSAAAAFIEDMAYFRDLLKRKEIKADEIRRSSAELRRLLIDNGGDLEKIAAPRIGRVHILAPQNNPYYRIGDKSPFTFFSSGGVTLFGATFRGMVVNMGNSSAPNMSKYGPEDTLPLSADGFLSQRVLCLKGRWITRRLLIKYIAHVGHGVHSGAIKDDNEKIVEQLRRVVTCGAPPHAALISFHIDALNEQKEVPFKYEPKSIDIALVELLATMHFLSISPDIIELEKVISAELAAP